MDCKKKYFQYTVLDISDLRNPEDVQPITGSSLLLKMPHDYNRIFHKVDNLFDTDKLKKFGASYGTFIADVHEGIVDFIIGIEICSPICSQSEGTRIYTPTYSNFDEKLITSFNKNEFSCLLRIRIYDLDPKFPFSYLLFVLNLKLKEGYTMENLMLDEKISDYSADVYHNFLLPDQRPRESLNIGASIYISFPLKKARDNKIKLPIVSVNFQTILVATRSQMNFKVDFSEEFNKFNHNLTERFYSRKHEDSIKTTTLEMHANYKGFKSLILHESCDLKDHLKTKCNKNGNVVCKDPTKASPPSCDETVIFKNPCLHNGAYINLKENQTITTHTGKCDCAQGFYGNICQFKITDDIISEDCLLDSENPKCQPKICHTKVNCRNGKCTLENKINKCECNERKYVGKRCEFECPKYCNCNICRFTKGVINCLPECKDPEADKLLCDHPNYYPLIFIVILGLIYLFLLCYIIMRLRKVLFKKGSYKLSSVKTTNLPMTYTNDPSDIVKMGSYFDEKEDQSTRSRSFIVE